MFGSSKINKILYGSSNVKKVFYGSTLIYSASSLKDWGWTGPIATADDLPYAMEEMTMGCYYMAIKYYPASGGYGIVNYYNDESISNEEWATWTTIFTGANYRDVASYITSVTDVNQYDEFLIQSQNQGSGDLVNVYARKTT